MGHIFNDAVTFNGAAAFNGSTSGVTASTANNTELNLIGNPSSATGWSVVNTAGSNPMAVATTVTAGDLPLSGSIANAIKFTSRTVAGAEASEYVTYSFTTPASLSGKMKIEFYMRTGTNFLGGDWTVSLYQSTTRQSLSTDVSGATTLPLANGKFTTTVDLLASTAYTLRFARPTNAGSNAAVLNVANVIVGPGIQPQGAVVGPVTSYTPTFAGLGTGSATATGFYYRGGENAVISVRLIKDGSGGSGSTPVTITLPTGLTGNTILTPNSRVGTAAFSGVNYGPHMDAFLATNTTVKVRKNGTATDFTGADMTASGELNFDLIVPIAEWAGSGTVNLAQNDVEYAYNTSGITAAGATNTTSFGYGPQGAAIGNIASTTTTSSTTDFRVRFQTPIQAGDQIILETDQGSASARWVTWSSSGISDLMYQKTAIFGTQVVQVNTTDYDVSFGNAGRASNGTNYGDAGVTWSGISTWRWRVRKSSAGAAVGFGIVVPGTSSGLVSASGLPGNTTGNAIASGFVGERLSVSTSASHGGTTATGAGTALGSIATNTNYILQSSSGVPIKLSLTPGVWDIYMHNEIDQAIKVSQATGLTLLQNGLSTNPTATSPSNFSRNSRRDLLGDSTTGLNTMFVAKLYVNSASSVDVYSIVFVQGTVTGLNISVNIQAIRIA